MRQRSLSLLALSLTGLSLFGFGCKPGWNDPFAASRQAAASRQSDLVGYTPSTVAPPRASEAEVAMKDVNTALGKLATASSFRTSLKLPSKNGNTTAEIEYAQGQGLHGTLHIPGPVTAEVYALGAKTYYRVQSGGWQDLSGTAEGKLLTEQLQTSLTLTGADQSPLASTDQIVEVSWDRSGCRLVVFRPIKPKNAEDTISVCVKNGYPTFISAQADTPATVEARYWDFDKRITFDVPKDAVVPSATAGL